MTLEEMMQILTPGELDAVKQDYRQGYDWRRTLERGRPPAMGSDSDRAKLDEIAECLEREFFPGLPRIVRHDKRGQPVPPKGGRWVDGGS
jgi:hypothetical protein